jgi:hypothetical protein
LKVTVVVSERGRLALDERVQLVRSAAEVDDVLVAARPGAAVHGLGRRAVPYLLDVNRVTAGVALFLAARRRPFVLDTGDDPATLARATHGRATALAYGRVERMMLRGARAVVCRGSFHQPVLRSRTAIPIHWAPDTVPDDLLDDDADRGTPDADLVATFGSAASPAHGDRAYGWEVVDLVAATPGLRGLLVVHGAGIEALRARAARLGVSSRVSVEGSRPLRDLGRRLAPAAFVTSLQSDDLAGWVRTTGKLPICLGLGKALVTTRVGEASRILPDAFLVESGDDTQVVTSMQEIVGRGVPAGWEREARRLAEAFRRTTVAAGLRRFLSSL